MSTTVHITDQGNQTIYGVKTFDVFPIVSGNKLITGVNLSSYLTSSTASSTYSTITNLASTGSTLTNNIVSLSGLFTGFTGNLDTTFASDVQLANTGSTLVTSINSLSGLFTGFTGALDATFASDIQLASTGSTLQTNINNLSNTYATITNLASTGSTLVTNLASTGSTLDVKINNLSGVSVLTFGNQTISGVKTFATGVNISGHVGIGIDSNNFNLYVRKSPAGVSVNPDNNSIAVFEGSGSSHITVLGSTSASAGVVLGSPADTFGSYLSWNHDNNALKLSTAKPSGFIQLLTNDEVEALRITSGANVGIGTTSPSEKLQVVGNILANNLVYNTGNQTISGIKTFAQTGSFDTLQITNKKLSSYNYVSSNFTFDNAYINIANSSNNIIGTLPSGITSGINYYVKNLNTGILLITGSGQRTIDGFSTVNLYKNESLQLLGVSNVGYTGWVTLSADNGVS
jgi:hypothetical protein